MNGTEQNHFDKRFADLESTQARTQSEVHGLWRAMNALTDEVKKIAEGISQRSRFNWEQLGIIVLIVGSGSIFLSDRISRNGDVITEGKREIIESIRETKLDVRREMELRADFSSFKIEGIRKQIDAIEDEQRQYAPRVYGTSDGTDRRLRFLEQTIAESLTGKNSSP